MIYSLCSDLDSPQSRWPRTGARDRRSPQFRSAISDDARKSGFSDSDVSPYYERPDLDMMNCSTLASLIKLRQDGEVDRRTHGGKSRNLVG